jgi:hypothetical protein
MNSNTNSVQQNILRKQQETTAKINSLLEKSSELLACGPTCQKQKVTDSLKQKYLNAQTNLLTAPEQLDTAKRNYYVYTEGESSYSNMLEKDLTNTASSISDNLSNAFNQVVNYAETMNKYYSSALLNSINSDELLNDYTDKNMHLTNNLGSIRGDILTNDRKTVYEEEAIIRIKDWYNLLWYTYYIFVLVYLLATLFVPASISILMRIIIFILLVLYPYYSHTIFIFISKLFSNIYTIFPKNVYNSL